MKLLVPVNGIKSCKLQIEAGANEIYVAGATDIFHSMSFSGRGQYNTLGQKICPDKTELKDIINYAHENNADVLFAANMPFLANDPNGTKKFENSFLSYVEQGIDLGADYVVIGDIGAILSIKSRGIEIPLVASSFFEIINKYQVEFFLELGVQRIILSYQLSIKEIEEIVSYFKNRKVSFEVFGHFGCSFFDNCNFKHSFGENLDDKIGIPCRNKYAMLKNNEVIFKGQIFNSALICSACQIFKFISMGIYSLKLVGRDTDMGFNSKITGIYSKLINTAQKDSLSNNDFLNFKNEVIPDWWVNLYCNNSLCKYKSGKVVDSYC